MKQYKTAIGHGDGGGLVPHPAIEVHQALLVRRGCGGDFGGMGRICSLQGSRDPVRVQDRVRDIHPEVRILCLARVTRKERNPRQVDPQLEERNVLPGRSNRLLEPVIEPKPIHHEQIG